MREGQRAVSPVIGVVIMVGIVVILSAVVGSMVLTTGSESVEDSDPNPYLGTDIDGEIVYDTSPGCSTDDKHQLQLEHSGGDSVPMKNIVISIQNEEKDEQTTLTDLPMDNTGGSTSGYDTHTAGSSDILWEAKTCAWGPVVDRDSPFNPDLTWSSGQTIGLTLKSPDHDEETLVVKAIDRENDVTIAETEVTYIDPDS